MPVAQKIKNHNSTGFTIIITTKPRHSCTIPSTIRSKKEGKCEPILRLVTAQNAIKEK